MTFYAFYGSKKSQNTDFSVYKFTISYIINSSKKYYLCSNKQPYRC